MRGVLLLFLCCLCLLSASGGDVHKSEHVEMQETGSQTAVLQPPVKEHMKPLASLSEVEIRAEIEMRQQRLKEKREKLKAMWTERNYAGSTELLRTAATDNRRLMLLEKRLKEIKAAPPQQADRTAAQ